MKYMSLVQMTTSGTASVHHCRVHVDPSRTFRKCGPPRSVSHLPALRIGQPFCLIVTGVG
jgi:hypothetical protein